MTSKIIVNNIEADTGVSSVTFNSTLSASAINATNLTGTNVTNANLQVTGNVGIGTTDPQAPFGGRALQLGNISDARSVFTLQSSTTGRNSIYFSDDTAGGGTYRGYIDYIHSDNVMVFGVETSEAARFTSSGNLRFPSGQGIDFSANANASGMASELLNDYETGTWTPTVNGWTGVTYIIREGVYTKVGNLVTAWVYLSFSGTNGATNVTISGLPFNVSTSSAYARGGAPTYYNVPLNETTGVLFYPAAATEIYLYADNDGGNLIQSNGNASSQSIIGSVHYIA